MNLGKNQPLVSIIMPTYNSENTVKESISSVLQQTYSNWELIISDDNSTDQTVEVVKNFDDPRIKVHQLTHNGGAGVARNNSIEKANGRYIAFLDSDDLWLPRKLEKQIEYMEKNGYALTYSSYQVFDNTGTIGTITPPQSITYNELIYSNVIGCLTAVYNADMIGKRYMPLIRKRQDMGLWLSILRDIDKAYAINEVLARYRKDSGMTSNKFKILRWQWYFYRDELNFSIFKTIKVFFVYGYKGIMKHYHKK